MEITKETKRISVIICLVVGTFGAGYNLGVFTTTNNSVAGALFVFMTVATVVVTIHAIDIIAKISKANNILIDACKSIKMDLENNGECYGTDDARIEMLQGTIDEVEGEQEEIPDK